MFKNRNITSLRKIKSILEIKIKNLSQQGTIVEKKFFQIMREKMITILIQFII